MVIILGKNFRNNNRFISVRWKIVSTYLLLVIILLILINIFIGQRFLEIFLGEKRIETLTQANTVANSIFFYMGSKEVDDFIYYLNYATGDNSKKYEARIIVIDRYNTVLSDSNNEYNGKTFRHKEIESALSGETDHGVYNFTSYGHVLYTSVPILRDDKVVGAVLLSKSLNDIYEKTDQVSYQLMLISIISIFFIALLAFMFADFLAKPIKRFIDAISKVSHNQLEQRIQIKANDEFKIMGNAFNLMISKLNQVDKQRKDFVANVSHELRTPLSSMKLLSESLIHQNEEDISIFKDFLQDINSEVDRLNNIIDDLLIHVDLDKEKLTLNLKTVSINYILEKIVSRLKPLADEKGIEIKLIFKDQIQRNIDLDKFQQAIINVIHNAIKYTPNGGKIDVVLYAKDNLTVIEVKDNGIGISQDSLEHIFDRFYRVDKSRSRNTGGTGLGLSIAYQIVSLHQGTIDVESEIGKGSIFYIKIPETLG